MTNLVQGDTLVFTTNISDIEISLVKNIGMVLDTGSQKIIENPQSLTDVDFIWEKEETVGFPLRSVRARLFVETVDGKRFTVALTAIAVLKKFEVMV
jgi:hypothetical protein